jgi:cation diffusion facilitator CzcD-associated flavoprotein CzcO
LKDKRVAVIGNGSSGIQAFGAIQKEASTVAHYIRTPTWISLNYMSQFTRDGRNFDCNCLLKYLPENCPNPHLDSDEEKTSFSDPKQLAAYRRKLETTSNGLFKNLVFDETCQDVKKTFRTTTERVMMERLSATPELIKRLIPAYQPWCRRLTPGDDYLFALQRPNAALYDSQIDSVDTHGIKTKDGIYKEWDVIVTATGFVNNRIPPWKMTGLNGITLAERWKEDADGYLSVCAPSMPNYFAVGQTPNFTIANGSVLSAFGFVTDYILRWATKIATEDIKSVVVKDEAVMAYNIYLQQVLRRTAWNGECESWYKKGRRDEYRTGITAIYPGSLNHFRSMLEKERGEDFDVKYRSANRFNFYGNGLTELDMTDGADLAFYLEKTMKLENMI